MVPLEHLPYAGGPQKPPGSKGNRKGKKMAKRGLNNTDTTQERTPEQIIADLKIENENLKEAAKLNDNIASRYMSEEAAIRKRGNVGAERIQVKEIADHKNISLWTKWGKRIGPMHRDNALDALKRFGALGVSLSAERPTEEQVDTWLASTAGKAWQAGEEKKKHDNEKTRKGAAMERIMKQMANQYGLTMDTLKGVLPQTQVRPASEGPGRQ